jgi:hypothetical protein
MAEDGTPLEGRFSFEEEKLRFYPINGIRPGREYTISLSTVAEDQWGNSLEKEYHRAFFTKPEKETPWVTSVFPEDESILTDYPTEIRIYFSESINPHSFDNALRISPAISSVIQWEQDYREAIIQLVKPLDWGKRYTITLSTGLQDRSGNSMVTPFTSTFLLGNIDRNAPEISIDWASPKGTGPVLPGGTINSGIPGDAEFSVTFNRDIGMESLAGFIEVQPSLGITVSPERDSRSHTFIRLSQRPLWGKPYTLIIRKGIISSDDGVIAEDQSYFLCFDAPEFMPPEFIRGYFKNGTENNILSQETDFDFLILDVIDFPTTGTPVPTELCLVFSISSEASSLSPASAMDAFSLSASNGCASISIKTLRILNEVSYRGSGFNDPSLVAGDGKTLCALVYGLEIENTTRDGLLIFNINSTLSDPLGNSLGENINITWNKK